MNILDYLSITQFIANVQERMLSEHGYIKELVSFYIYSNSERIKCLVFDDPWTREVNFVIDPDSNTYTTFSLVRNDLLANVCEIN